MSSFKEIKVSPFTKFCTKAFLMITPEYKEIKKAKKMFQSIEPTFSTLPDMPISSIDIKGVNIRYAHSSLEDKPTVILLSPLPQSIIAFAPIWGILSKRYNLYAVDLPGYGRSEGGNEYMTFKRQGKFLQDFIDVFNIKNPHIVGPDVGMAASLSYVCHNSTNVSSLLIGDGPGAKPSQNGSVINKLEKSRFWRTAFGILGSEVFAYAGINLGYVNYSPNQEEFNDYVLSYKGRIKTSTLWFKNYSSSIDSIQNNLKDISTPTLIFWGDKDKFLLPENVDTLEKIIPNTEIKIFKNCGHFSYQDKYKEFADMVINWIDGGYSKIL